MSRGGKRKGSGVKPDTGTRNAAKPDGKKRTIKKSYNWTPEEYARIQEAVKVSGKREAEIIQEGTLRVVDEILTAYNKQNEADFKPAATILLN